MQLLSKIGSWLSGGGKIVIGVVLYLKGNTELGIASIISGIGTLTSATANKLIK